MHESANGGVSGDVPRDGVGDTSSRVVVPVADQLRNLADWLDAHPGADVSTVSFINARTGRPVEVNDFTARTKTDAAVAAMALGGRWDEFTHGPQITGFRQEVMPGFEFRFIW